MSCVECGHSSNYKCPVCRQAYCSVACCKKHKEKQCVAPPTPVTKDIKPEIKYEYPTEDTVPIEKLQLLGDSEDLKKCLANPYLREILTTLDNSPHPDYLIQEYMQEPIFTEFVDECLKVVQMDKD